MQKFLFDKKMEPMLRKLLADDEGGEYVRAEVLGLLAQLVQHDKWVGAIQVCVGIWARSLIAVCVLRYVQ